MVTDISTILASLPDILDAIDNDVAAKERERVLPYASVNVLRQSGLLRLRIPKNQGGVGGSIRHQMEAIIAVASVDANLAQAVRPHFFFIEELRTHGVGRSPAYWWPRLATSALVGNALSEASTARVGSIESQLRCTGDGRWRLNGQKSYSTGALFSDLLYVSGKDADGIDRRALIPSNRAGITLLDDWAALGQRTTATGTTLFKDVEILDEEILELTSLDETFTHMGGQRQLFLAAILAGIVANASRDLNCYIRTKARPSAHGLTDTAATDPYVLRSAGQVSSAAFAAKAIVLSAAERLDHACSFPGQEDVAFAAAADVARAQCAVADLVLPGLDRLFDSGGASAVGDALNLHRHWRNARTVITHNPLDYKRHAIANWEINAVELPRNSYF